MNGLAFADTTHTVCTLSIIPEHHILADGNDSASGWALLDIDTRCVNLIEKSEPVHTKNHSKRKESDAELHGERTC
jgi:hypothetical protein